MENLSLACRCMSHWKSINGNESAVLLLLYLKQYTGTQNMVNSRNFIQQRQLKTKVIYTRIDVLQAIGGKTNMVLLIQRNATYIFQWVVLIKLK